MFQMVLLGLGLMLGSASAAEVPTAPNPEQASATVGPFGGGKGPAETVGTEIEEKKSEKELERIKRLEAIEEASKAQAARVVVLQWKGTDTDYRNDNLQRNVRSRIARPEARFYPDIDLYQSGRKEPDPTVRPGDQRAMVPDSAIPRLLDAADEVATIPWNGLSEADWGSRAQDLLRLSEEVWFIDRPELREPLFLLYAQIGRAAENASQGAPPYYESVRGRTVNYFWYLAASLAHTDPSLLSKITDSELNTSITYLKDQIDSGAFTPMTMSFVLDDRTFDATGFATEYILTIDGIESTITNSDGLVNVPPGRADVYLKREDGHSLSDRVETGKLNDKIYFVRQNARTLMGLDFISQLMENPYECTPAIDGNILTYLSIYQRLHPTSDIYIVVPKEGSTAPGRLFLWRWNPITAQLTLVKDNTGGFPIRFALLGSTGITIETVDLQPDEVTGDDLAGTATPGTGTATAGQAGALADNAYSVQTALDGVPLDLQLRGHYNRLLMAVGLQYKVGVPGADDPPEGKYEDLYQTNGYNVVKPGEPRGCGDFSNQSANIPSSCFDENNNFNPDGSYVPDVLALRQRKIQRLVYMTLGVVLGRDAPSGWGPRGYLRFGWTNAPHAVDLTAHIGYTARVGGGGKERAKKDEDRGGRVRAILDIDVFGGALLPARSSYYMLKPKVIGQPKPFYVGKPLPTLGITAGAGLTF